MQNDFEKRVQQQLEEFSISPSKTVWNKVAGKIAREKKRRRLVIFWWTAAILSVGLGTGLWLSKSSLAGGENQLAASTQQQEKRTPPPAGTAPHTFGTKPSSGPLVAITPYDDLTVINQNAKKPNTNIDTPHMQISGAKAGRPVYSPGNGVASNKPLQENKTRKSTTGQPAFGTRKQTRNLTTAGYANSAINRPEPVKKQLPQVPLMASVTQQNSRLTDRRFVREDTGSNNGNLPVALTDVDQGAEMEVAARTPDSSRAQPLATRGDTAVQSRLTGNLVSLIPQRRTYFGFVFSGGISDNRTGFPVLSEKALSDLSTSMPTNSTGASTRADNPLNTGFSSKFSFGFGGFAGRMLNKRLAITTGINYHYYASGSSAVYKVNASRNLYDTALGSVVNLNTFYTNAQTNFGAGTSTFNNRYHLLQLPFLIEYQVKKNAKRPMFIQAGITPAVVLSTTALYYNTSANITYVNRQQFEQLQLFATGGFRVRVATINKMQYSLGPQLQYGLTNLTRSVVQSRQHLFFAGLQAAITFKK